MSLHEMLLLDQGHTVRIRELGQTLQAEIPPDARTRPMPEIGRV